MNIKNTLETQFAQQLVNLLNVKAKGLPSNLTDAEWNLVNACEAFLLENTE